MTPTTTTTEIPVCWAYRGLFCLNAEYRLPGAGEADASYRARLEVWTAAQVGKAGPAGEAYYWVVIPRVGESRRGWAVTFAEAKAVAVIAAKAIVVEGAAPEAGHFVACDSLRQEAAERLAGW